DGGRIELHVVLVHVNARRMRGVVLLRDVDPVVARGAGEDLALIEGILRDLALRHRPCRVHLADGKIRGDEREYDGRHSGQGERQEARHRRKTPGAQACAGRTTGSDSSRVSGDSTSVGSRLSTHDTAIEMGPTIRSAPRAQGSAWFNSLASG